MKVYNPMSVSYTKNQADNKFITINLNDVEPGSPEENLLQELSKKVSIISNATDFLYSGTFTIDGWTETDSEEKSNGYNYFQQISVSSLNENAPEIKTDSQFLPCFGFQSTGVVSTDESLLDTLNIINQGKSTSGNGTIKTFVKNKPSTDITITWVLRTEV